MSVGEVPSDELLSPVQHCWNHVHWTPAQLSACTDKNEKKIFLIYREIQSGAVAKSYIRNGFLIYSMRKSKNISPYMGRPLVIYDFATAPL